MSRSALLGVLFHKPAMAQFVLITLFRDTFFFFFVTRRENSRVRVITKKMVLVLRQGPKYEASLWELISQRWGMRWGKREKGAHTRNGGYWCLCIINIVKIQRALTWCQHISNVKEDCLDPNPLSFTLLSDRTKPVSRNAEFTFKSVFHMTLSQTVKHAIYIRLHF